MSNRAMYCFAKMSGALLVTLLSVWPMSAATNPLNGPRCGGETPPRQPAGRRRYAKLKRPGFDRGVSGQD
jgi:hypothetical protein